MAFKLDERLQRVIDEAISRDIPLLHDSFKDWCEVECLKDVGRLRVFIEKLDKFLDEYFVVVQDSDPDDVVSEILFPSPFWETVLTTESDKIPDLNEIVSHILSVFPDRKKLIKKPDCSLGRREILDAFLDDEIWSRAERLSRENSVFSTHVVEQLLNLAKAWRHHPQASVCSCDVFSSMNFIFGELDLFDIIGPFVNKVMMRYACLTLLMRLDKLLV